jgi:ubiquinone/menaquinone biosynthesis C-methylase UbiE
VQTRNDDNITQSIRESYDRLADEYARQLFNELQNKPLDRELLDRFAGETLGRGEVCDLGSGPGHVARYLRDAGVAVFGLDLSSRMVEEARQLNPDIRFRQGNMMALDFENNELAGIAAFYAIVNIPKESLPLVFRQMWRVLQPEGLLVACLSHGRRNTSPAGVVGSTDLNGLVLFPDLGNSRLPRSRGLCN